MSKLEQRKEHARETLSRLKDKDPTSNMFTTQIHNQDRLRVIAVLEAVYRDIHSGAIPRDSDTYRVLKREWMLENPKP